MFNMEKAMILMDKIAEIQRLGNYASITFSNWGYEVDLYAMQGEFEPGKEYAVCRSFDFNNEQMFKCTIEELEGFIHSFAEKEMNLKEIEAALDYRVKIVGEE